MRIGFRLLLIVGAVLAALPAWAQAPAAATGSAPAATAGATGNAPVYVVTYFESAPASANSVARTLRRFAAATRKEDGNAGFIALREARRPGRFALFEAWRDKNALDAHAKAAAALRDRLQPELAAPFDSRPCVALDVAAPPAAGKAEGGRTLYVLTHVDVIPPKKDEALGLVKQLAADSRKDSGALRYDVVQQANRANHLFLVEAWRDRAAFDGYLMTDPTRQFRDKLLPLQGALYDERLYEAIR